MPVRKTFDFSFMTNNKPGDEEPGGGHLLRNNDPGNFVNLPSFPRNAPTPVNNLQLPLPIAQPAQSIWDKLKKFDMRGIGNSLGQEIGQGVNGIAHGISQAGMFNNTGSTNLLLKNTLPGMSDIGKQQQATQQAQQNYLTAHPVSGIGGMIGEQLPQLPLWLGGEGLVGAAGKGLTKLAPSLLPFAEKVGTKLPGIVKGGLKDAATFGSIVAPVQTMQQGTGFNGFLQNEKQLPGVLLGGIGLRGAGKLVSKGVDATRSFLKPLGVPSAPIQSTPLRTLPESAPAEITTQPQVNNLASPLSRTVETPGVAQPQPNIGPVQDPINRDILSRFKTRADQGTPGQAIPPVETGVPQPLNNANPVLNERRFAQNVRDSSVAPDVVKSNLDTNQLTYEPITNKATFDKATATVDENPIKAMEQYNAPSKGVSADDVALGEALITKAIKSGDNVGANQLIADLAEKLTQAGQAVQAASIFKRLSPEGMLLYANRVVNTVNKNLVERLGTKATKVEITPEDSKFIMETMQRVQTLPDGAEKDIAMAQVKKLIGEKVPSTLSDKVMALQRISLLLNPKTMVRNVVGNTIFGMVDNVSNAIATPIDKLTSKLLGTPRTTALPSVTGQLKSMGEGLKVANRDSKMSVDTYNDKTQYEFSGKKNFTGTDPLNKTLNWLDNKTIRGLKYGDVPFHKAALDDSLRQQMKLAGVDKPTAAMIDQAQKTADQRTYQDVNAMTDAFKMVQKSLNKISSAVHLGNENFGLGNLVMPFVKTPANILKRALEYSPLGITDALKEATKLGKGTFDQKVFVDSISRSVTGTALIMVGYDLAKRGIITGSGNKDKDVASFERGLGKNDYAFKFGNNFYTYDWAQPASMALAIGADIQIKGQDRKQAQNVVVDAVKSGGETLFKQSVLQGITRFMSGYSPMDNLATAALNGPNQFIPTLGKQISQMLDPTQRSTYSPTNLGTEGNLLKARTPGLTNSLEPKINTSGETMQNFQGKNNLFNIFVNPGSATTFTPNKVQSEILRLYDATGDKAIFPNVAPKSFSDNGQSITLTPQETTKFQQTMGKNAQDYMSSIADSSTTDAAKVKELTKVVQQSYIAAKEELLRNRSK